jgi:hypothetical protein
MYAERQTVFSHLVNPFGESFDRDCVLDSAFSMSMISAFAKVDMVRLQMPMDLA